METITVKAYDHSGNKRVPIEAMVGDEVDYKKDGVAGSYRAIVVGWKTQKMVRIKIVSHMGLQVEPRVTHVKPRFLSVWRDGRRLP